MAAPLAKAWRLLTEPVLRDSRWAAGEVATAFGHQFTLDRTGYGKQP